MQFFSADAAIFLKNLDFFFAHENMKNHPQKLLIIGPIFFSVLPIEPKPAQISIPVP
jgi:hypothetical protein